MLQTRSKPSAKPIISLTPLIDVVLILLVFFMLAPSFVDWRALSLDTGAAGRLAPSEQTPFIVQLDGESLRLEGAAISLDALIEQARSRQPADQPVSLQPWLERHKEYPRHARLRRQEGRVLLYFRIDRAGRVLDYRIEQSSGYSLLDGEVRRMIERAQPLPAMPASMDQSSLELVVPVQFFLR